MKTLTCKILLSIEWNSIGLGSPAHGIVTKSSGWCGEGVGGGGRCLMTDMKLTFFLYHISVSRYR